MKQVLLVLVFVLGCAGSSAQTQAVVTDRIARSANAALPTIVQAYQAQGDAAIDAAPDRASATAALAAVRQRWAPVWLAWAILRASVETYATALESAHGDTAGLDAAPVERAWCGFLRALPAPLSAAAVTGVVCPP